ncbi:MAG: RloB family protein [Pseudomonadota bacterium]
MCEGEKTEPEYLRALRKAFDLNPANVKIVAANGNDPVSIVQEAIETYDSNPGEFDRVFCVFDRDGHAHYQQALDLVANSPLGRNGVVTAITSVPCFEIWILLHYAYSSAPVAASGARSACENVVAAIRRHLPEYEKAFGDLFEKLAPMLDTAITHADRLAMHNRDTGSDNPATKVHDLVKYLRSLKRD